MQPVGKSSNVRKDAAEAVTGQSVAQPQNPLQEYLARSLDNGLYQEYFEKDVAGKIRFRGTKIPPDLINTIWEGYLAFELERQNGDHFSHYYYTSDLYRCDYEEILGRKFGSVYEVDASWPNYAKLRARINERFAEWRKLKDMLARA